MSSKSITKAKKSKRTKKMKTFTDPRDDERYNLKPSNLEQTLTKKQIEFEEQINACKNPVSRKRKKNKFHIEILEKDQPRWKKKKGESDDGFLRRVDRDTHQYVAKVQFEEKFQINKKPDILNEDAPQKENKGRLKSNRKMKEKKDKRKKKKLDKVDSKRDDFNKMKDEVKFGEVVMGPPALNKENKTKNSNLLLAKKFGVEGDVKKAKVTGLSDDMEEERKKVIAFYRMNKARKYAGRQFEDLEL